MTWRLPQFSRDTGVYIAATACLFLLLFGPKTLAGNFDTLGTACGIAAVIWWRHISNAFESADFWVTIAACAYVLLVLAFTSVPDGWWALKPPRMLLNYLGVFGFTTWGLRRFGRDRMILMLHNAITAHAMVVLLMIIFVPFGDFIEGLFGGVTKSTFQVSGLTRALALAAIVMMFPFVTYPLFSMLHGYKERGIMLKLSLIVAATFFMGRTGFYLCLGTSVLIVTVLGARNARTRKLMAGMVAGILVAGALLLHFRLAPAASPLSRIPGMSTINEPIGHMLEPIENYLRGSGLRSRSVEHILDMPVVYHNDTFLETVFGTGFYGRGDPFTHLPTDVAYLHMFSAFGIVGVSLFLLAYLIPYPQYSALWRTAPYWASIAIAGMTIIANVKETALFTRHLYTVHVFFIAWLAAEARRDVSE